MGNADVVGVFHILSFFNTLKGVPAVRGAHATNHTRDEKDVIHLNKPKTQTKPKLFSLINP